MDGTSAPGRLVDLDVASEWQAPGEIPPRFRTLLIGQETLLIECAAILRRLGHEIVGVVAPPGPAADWALAEKLVHAAHHAELGTADLGPVDYLFSITNLSVLLPEWLALPRLGAINFHDGPLPDYAGLNTPVWALLNGEARHGVTWHRMTETVDGGDIVASESFAIDADESALSLNAKCFEAGLRSFAGLAERLAAGRGEAVPQASPARHRFGRGDRPALAATIDWNRPAGEIARLVSALDFGPYRNPLGCPKLLAGDRLLLVQKVEVMAARSGLPAGTVVAGGPAPVIATASEDVRLVGVADLNGVTLDDPGLGAGERLAAVDTARGLELSALDSAAGRYEHWWRVRLAARDPLSLPHFRAASAAGVRQTDDLLFDRPRSPEQLRAATLALLGRLADRADVDIGYCDPIYRSRVEGVAEWFAGQLPLRVTLDWDQPLAALAELAAVEVREMHRRVAISADLIARSPELRGASLAHPIAIELVDRLDTARFDDETLLGIAIARDGSGIRWHFDDARLDPEMVRDFGRTLTVMLDAAPDTPLGRLPLLTDAEQTAMRAVSEGPVAEVAEGAIHRLFVEQARRTPDRIAVTSRGVSLSYAELDARSNRLARHLAALGVGPETLVGLHLERSVELVVAMLAIHKAGGAYVPLDPAYPAERLTHMIADSGLAGIVTQDALAATLPPNAAWIVRVDGNRAAIEACAPDTFDGGAEGANLAYVIYTSGSTGLPKGVMVEHRNVANFFAGMDAKLEPEGTWLAVTSPSFDISVLELCWPLTRGYHVVIATEREVRGDVRAPAPAAQRPLGFSLFYFASADSASHAEQYRLLLEGAKFADTHGFEAVWTPERHFHEFGGLYPNPSVISAAIAVSTSRVKIRAGSCVAPLHHPARIAEEWALVDNLSGGRVGIAFASGWQPNDFALRPENFADKNGALIRTIADVRALWRGEKRSFPGPLGTPVELGVFPRPVQPELPFWITSAGNPETFAAAGRVGANLLTHLLGQKVEEVAVKLDAYRRAWREAGHPDEGYVTMMLHSFVGDDAASVREIVRAPLIDYLRTSTGLLKQYAWSFPAFRRPEGSDAADQPDLASLSDDETEALLEHAFDRYFETSGLFGTPEQCVDLIDRLRAVGVDEIGCLIDFGVPTQTVLDHLPQLDRLRALTTAPREQAAEMSLAELIARHGVTHLQCTPSLAQMLASDAPSRQALTGLKRLMVGGEAFPAPLAQDLTALVGGAVMNMYGPTETTIWSAVHQLDKDAMGAPPLGTPLANQTLHIVDARMQLVRPGTPGELLIGGNGVVRGYLDRPALTAERFVADPFAGGEARAYRTGDIVRRAANGRLDYLGRADHQIKIRGYRVELGEIEAALTRHPDIAEAVVVAREEDGTARLLAYYVASPGGAVEADALRSHLRDGLPDFMVPAAFVALDALPRTPNGKIDRKALPEPRVEGPREVEALIRFDNPLQQQILAIWRDVLKVDRVGLRDNFFDLGGHSLLAVQAHRRLAAIAEQPVSLTDIFRFPTIEALSAHLGGGEGVRPPATTGRDRAQSRRRAMQRRAGVLVGN